ncbi:MAG: hypothetical protein U0517_01220 [Candidatus Andersenbacteria bacterium]
MTFAEQMGNIGSELTRAVGRSPELRQQSLLRAEGLVDRTLREVGLRDAQRRELGLLKEQIKVGANLQDLVNYCLPFALLARREHDSRP